MASKMTAEEIFGKVSDFHGCGNGGNNCGKLSAKARERLGWDDREIVGAQLVAEETDHPVKEEGLSSHF